jgi:glutamate dehydrogenase (NADP+)
MINHASSGKESFTGKRVAVSGSGNVAQYAALKAIELGATVVSLSDSKGCLISTGDKGVTVKLVETVAKLKVERKSLAELGESAANEHGVKYIEGARPWIHVGKIDIALPCATQNEVNRQEAEALVEAGCKFVAEGSNMGCEQAAIEVFEENRKSKKREAIWYAPGKWHLYFPFNILALLTNLDALRRVGKAANAGGVAVSGLEMAQNSQRMSWTAEEVDSKLKGIMEACFANGLKTAADYVKSAEGEYPSLVAGSNIAGFVKVAEATRAQGDWW